jgi:hypothetical protein
MMGNSLSSLETVSFSRNNKFYGLSYQTIGIGLYKINCQEQVNTPWFPHLHAEKDPCDALVKCL